MGPLQQRSGAAHDPREHAARDARPAGRRAGPTGSRRSQPDTHPMDSWSARAILCGWPPAIRLKPDSTLHSSLSRMKRRSSCRSPWTRGQACEFSISARRPGQDDGARGGSRQRRLRDRLRCPPTPNPHAGRNRCCRRCAKRECCSRSIGRHAPFAPVFDRILVDAPCSGLARSPRSGYPLAPFRGRSRRVRRTAGRAPPPRRRCAQAGRASCTRRARASRRKTNQ